jgi:hypothetical protein
MKHNPNNDEMPENVGEYSSNIGKKRTKKKIGMMEKRRQ